ncbi:hypothetical protein SUGI_0600990 [Cryptomeria japonica]|nr:hypothetical protein SUGI_0600990 [Cryptomeria japonica]
MISYSLWMLKKWHDQQHTVHGIHDLGVVTRPWFIYTLLSMGMLLCFIALLGHFAVETANGFSLSIYMFFVTSLLILQGGACFYIFVNKKWEDYVPEDPTGRFDQLKKFVKDNILICKGIGVITIAVQGLTIILAFILQSLGPEPNKDSQNNDEYLFKLAVEQSFLVRPPSLPNAHPESKLPWGNINSMEAQECGVEEENLSFSQVEQIRIPFLNGIQAED